MQKYCREINTCSCRKYPSSWRYYRTMDKSLTKMDYMLNNTTDRMKLSSETFVQGFAKTCSWTIDTKQSCHSHLSTRTFLLVTTLRKPTQFVPQIPHNLIFFLHPVRCPVYMSTDSKDDIRCNMHAFSTEIQSFSHTFFHVIANKKHDSIFDGILL